MKAVILLVLLSFVMMHTVSASGQDKVTIKQAVLIVTGGAYSPDHLGPETFEEVKSTILNNAACANHILLSEILNKKEYTSVLSSLHISGLLKLTSHNDPRGTLEIAKLYQKILDDSLREFDSSTNKDTYLQSKSEEDKNKIRRFIQQRNELKGLIEDKQK